LQKRPLQVAIIKQNSLYQQEVTTRCNKIKKPVMPFVIHYTNWHYKIKEAQNLKST